MQKSEKRIKTVEPEEYLFLGEFEHNLDSQGRIAIPSQWRRDEQGDVFVIVPGKGGFLQLIPAVSFKENFLAKAKKVSIGDEEGAMALAALGSRAQECKCDKQGRIQIGKKLTDYAGFDGGPVMLVGAVSSAQLWDMKRWNRRRIRDNESYFDEVRKINESPDDFVKAVKGTLEKLK